MIRYILPYENIATGGAELLIGMISKYVKTKRKDDNVTILCNTIDSNMEGYFDEIGISVSKVDNWNKARKKILAYNKKDEIRVIVLLWEDLMFFSSIRNKNIKVILWVAHFSGLGVGETCRYRWAKSIIKRTAARCIERLLKYGNIVCLDEMGVSYTVNYFENKLDSKQFKIIRMPVEIVNVNDEVLKRRCESKKMNMLTISRADFPFKGYLLGLIDFVKRLDERGEHFQLTIISYGEGIKVLEEKISQCSKTLRDKITLLGKTNYRELEKYYPDIKLYIGMDTTIIDAAQRGILSIPVVADTYELSAESFYHENELELRKTKNSRNNIEILYDAVKNMEEEEYYILSKKSRELVIDNFSIDKNVDRFLQLFSDAGGNKFYLDIFFFSCLYRIILTLRKGKKKFNESIEYIWHKTGSY